MTAHVIPDSFKGSLVGWRLWMHHGSNPVAGPDTAEDDDDSRPTLH